MPDQIVVKTWIKAAWKRQGPHGRIATVLIGLLLPFGLLFFSQFAWSTAFTINGGTSSEFDPNDASVLAQVWIASCAALLTIAYRFDVVWPSSKRSEAATRLLLPLIGLLTVGSVVANQGIFSASDSYHKWLFVIIVAGVLGVFLLLRHAPAPDVALSVEAPTPQTVAASSLRREMPTEMPQMEPGATIKVAAYPQTGLVPAPELPPGPSYVHRVTSGVITVGWVPLGALFWFASVWCANDGDRANLVALLFVAVQLLGNSLVGVWFDRRFGHDGGTMLAIGRSVGAAILFWLAALPIFILHGGSSYCG